MQVCFLFGSEVSLNLTVIRLSPSSYMKHRDLDTLVTTEELLDTTLAKQCTNLKVWSEFSLSLTDRIIIPPQEAYLLPAPHHQLAGGVCPHLSDARPPPPHSTPYLPLSVQGGATEFLLPCLTDLVRALWGIMLSYHKLVQWHRFWWEEDNEYTMNKLKADLGRMSKVLAVYHQLCLLDRFMQQCLNYFSSYHTSRLEELATHLDNEGWTLFPMKHTFSYPCCQSSPTSSP